MTREAAGTLTDIEIGQLIILREHMAGKVALPDPDPVVHIVKTQYEAPTPAAAPPPPSPQTPPESEEALHHASSEAASKKKTERDKQLKIDNYDVWCSIHEDEPEVQALIRERRFKEVLVMLPYGMRPRY